jgi:hypothetical protein
MVLKLGHCRYYMRNTRKVLKCGDGERWWSDGPIAWEVLHGVNKDRNILQSIKKAKWNGHISRRNSLLKHVINVKIGGRIQVTGKRGRRRKQTLNDLKINSGSWNLKEKALARTFWRTRFGTRYRPVARQTTEWISEWMNEWTNK